jgi:hypothetical protein
MFFDSDEGHHFFCRRLGRILAILLDRETDAGARITPSLHRVRALKAGRRAPR